MNVLIPRTHATNCQPRCGKRAPFSSCACPLWPPLFYGPIHCLPVPRPIYGVHNARWSLADANGLGIFLRQLAASSLPLHQAVPLHLLVLLFSVSLSLFFYQSLLVILFTSAPLLPPHYTYLPTKGRSYF